MNESEEKTVKGLNCCQECDGYTCRNVCPYHDGKEPEDQPTCTCHLAHDALAVIQAKNEEIARLKAALTPRVLALDEAAETDTCYVEYACGDVKPAFLRLAVQIGDYKSYHVTTENNHHYFDGCKYGQILRCWSVRPEEEQRKAEKWDV